MRLSSAQRANRNNAPFLLAVVPLGLFLSGCSPSVSQSELRIPIGGLHDGIVIHTPVKSAEEIKWTNVSRQSLDISCGPATLATLFNYYLGDQVTEMDIISFILQTSDPDKIKQIQKRQAFSLLDLKRYAVSKNYHAEGYRVTFQDLVDFKKPVIIPIDTLDFKHFVVFKGIIGDRVYLADPAFGNTTMRYPHFLYVWKERVALVVNHPDRQEIDNHALSLNGANGSYPDGIIPRALTPAFIDFVPRGDF
jgi:uncharacterized protein